MRTDFFTRPPRIDPTSLVQLWREQEGRDPPFTGPRILLELKKTAREKDWPVVGELARLLKDPREQMLCSRSPHDLIELDRVNPGLVGQLMATRPALSAIARGVDELRLELERERFAAMDADAQRIRAFTAATAGLDLVWTEVQTRVAGMPLRAAHAVIVESAETCLPTNPGGSPPRTSS